MRSFGIADMKEVLLSCSRCEEAASERDDADGLFTCLLYLITRCRNFVRRGPRLKQARRPSFLSLIPIL